MTDGQTHESNPARAHRKCNTLATSPVAMNVLTSRCWSPRVYENVYVNVSESFSGVLRLNIIMSLICCLYVSTIVLPVFVSPMTTVPLVKVYLVGRLKWLLHLSIISMFILLLLIASCCYKLPVNQYLRRCCWPISMLSKDLTSQ